MAIDLHSHSNVSDGYFTPEEIVRKAKRAGLSAIAVSDHDTCAGSIRAIKEGKKIGLKVIPAVEVSASYKGKVMHILAYFINLKNKKFNQALKKIGKYRIWRAKKILEKVNKDLRRTKQKTVSINEFFKFRNTERPLMMTDIAAFLVKKNLVKTKQEAFDKWLTKYNIPNKNLSPKETFGLIHQAGGLAILAHPGSKHLSLNDISKKMKAHKKMIKELKKDGLDGLEVSRKSRKYLKIAKKLGLTVSGGSDFHGPINPHLPQKIGAARIPNKILKNLELARQTLHHLPNITF